MQNDLLLKAAKGEKVLRPPVWLMRQAGRILPQYRKLRASLSGFKELVETPELACEVTIQPVDELNVDAAIIFSDILVIPEAMGLPYTMVEKVGPRFPKVIESVRDVEQVRVADASGVQYTLDAIKLTKRALNGRVPLIGFAGAPWTIFAYMLEGGGSKTFSKARRFLYQEPNASRALLEKITQSTINYLKGQIAAGADLVQIFDSWAGVLGPKQYSEFGIEYIRKICDAIDEVPITVFAKDAWYALPELGLLNCETIGLDWTVNPQNARNLINSSKTIQGNLDPCVLYADSQTIIKAVDNMLGQTGKQQYIANLGHGVYPDTPLDNVKVFIDTIKAC